MARTVEVPVGDMRRCPPPMIGRPPRARVFSCSERLLGVWADSWTGRDGCSKSVLDAQPTGAGGFSQATDEAIGGALSL